MDIGKCMVPASPSPPRYSMVVALVGGQQQKHDYNYKQDPKYQCLCGIHVEIMIFLIFSFNFS
jgi:hypothetical protein